MRLEETVKYIFILKINKNFIGFLSVLLFFNFGIYAQNYTLNCENISLSDALIKASESCHFKVAFDARKLENFKINKIVTANTPEELIKQLLFNTPFSFELKHDVFLVFEPSQTDKINKVCCQVIGSIADKDNGEQLPYAGVLLNDKNIFTSASSNGIFVLKNVEDNPLHLTIQYIGYLPYDTLIYWSKPIVSCSVKLKRKVQEIDTIVVKGDKLEMVDFRNDVDFATTINPAKLTDIPVVVETDIFKALQFLPGISYTSNSSELSIRGGSSDQNLVLYDGQTLYNLSHYYGVISVLNSNVVKDIQVYKGGYDSRYGERISGIVDITAKSGNNRRPTIYGDVNLVCANATTEIPIGNKFTLVAAYRKSYSDIYNSNLTNSIKTNTTTSYKSDTSSIVFETTPKFKFYDYNTKLTYHISDNENLSVSYFGSKDNYDNSYSGLASNYEVSVNENNKWGNYGLSSNWQKQWNPSVFTNLQIGASGYNNYYKDYTTIKMLKNNSEPALPQDTNTFNTLDKNELEDLSVSLKNILYLNRKHLLNFGILGRRNTIYYHKDAEVVYVYNNLHQKAWLTSAYIQDKYTLSSDFIIKPGIRLDYYLGNNNFYIEPRLSAWYKFSNSFSVRAATGRYYQFLSQVISQQETSYNKNFWVLTDDSVHPVLKATHFIVGSTFEKKGFLFDVEFYYKRFDGIQEYLYISPYLKNTEFPNYFNSQHGGQTSRATQSTNNESSANSSSLVKNPNPETDHRPSYFFIGEGRSLGMDLMVQYKSKYFTSWISYSLAKSVHRFDGINNGDEMPAPCDQRHQLSYTNILSVKKWNFSTTTLFATGRPYVDYSHMDQNIPTTWVYKRLPNYFRTDVSANYNFRIKNLRLKVGVTVVNVFDTDNYFDVNTRKFDFDNNSFAETNLIKSQSLSLNTYIHFSL